MSDSPTEDQSSEISRLWGKVSVPSVTEVPAPSSYDPGSAAWETLALLKRRQAREARRWSELLEAKEKVLQALSARAAAMEEELRLLRAQEGRFEQRALEEAAEVSLRLTEAMRALADEREARRQDREAFSAALESARAADRAELLRAQAALKEAKLALESTLAELLATRRAR